MKTAVSLFVVAVAGLASGCTTTVKHEITDLTARPIVEASGHPTLDTLPSTPPPVVIVKPTAPVVDVGAIEQDARAIMARSGAAAALDMISMARNDLPIGDPNAEALLVVESNLVDEEARRLAGRGRLDEAQMLVDRLVDDLEGRMPTQLSAIRVAVAEAAAQRAQRRGDAKKALSLLQDARAQVEDPDSAAAQALGITAIEVAKRAGLSNEACRLSWEMAPGGKVVVPAEFKQINRDDGQLQRDLADAFAAWQDERDAKNALLLLGRVRSHLGPTCGDYQRVTASMMAVAIRALHVREFKTLGDELTASLGRDTPPPAIVPVLALHHAMTGKRRLPIGTPAELRESLHRMFPNKEAGKE